MPWEKVTNGATGGMPADFWQKIRAAASTLVNALVIVGQVIYQGLVALRTFLVNLGQAIWNWGMQVIGHVSQAVAGAVQKVADAAMSLFQWIAEYFASLISGAIDAIASTLRGDMNEFGRQLLGLFSGPATPGATPPLVIAPLASFIWRVKEKLEDTFPVLEVAESTVTTVLMATGIGGPLKALLSKVTMDAMKKALLGVVIGTTIGAIVQDIMGLTNKAAVESQLGQVLGLTLGGPTLVLAFIEAWEKLSEKGTKTRSKFAIGAAWALTGLALELFVVPFLDDMLGTASGKLLLVVDCVAAGMVTIALLIMSGKAIFKVGMGAKIIDALVEYLGPITTGIEKLMTVVGATSTFASIGVHVAAGDYTK